MAALGGRIGLLPALIALLLVQHVADRAQITVTGLENVAEDVVEAARGIGMSRTQILTRVRLR